jgi:hypothetical protein
MISKKGWLKDAVAKESGFYTAKGEKLKGIALTQEFCDEWNGVKPAPAPKKPEPKVEAVVVEEEEVVVEEAPKKKGASKQGKFAQAVSKAKKKLGK